MQLVLSHLLAFCVLSIGAVFDWKTTEVPDYINVIGVIGGVLLHLWASLPQMDFGTLLSPLVVFSPVEWFSALGEPLAWSLAVGTVFSLYGWGSYFLGMWGGADAFAMSVLGFAAPYSLSGADIAYPVSIFVAVLGLGFVYSLFYGFFQALRNPEIILKAKDKLKHSERRIAIEILFASLISAIAGLKSLFLGLIYFAVLIFLIIILRIFKVVQNEVMHDRVKLDDLEGGEVVDIDKLGKEIENIRSKNLIGRSIEFLRLKLPENYLFNNLDNFLMKAERRIGYPEVVGIKQEQVQKLEENDIERVYVKKGLKFVPIFPAALFLVDIIGFRISWLLVILS